MLFFRDRYHQDVVTYKAALVACRRCAQWQTSLTLLNAAPEVEGWGQWGKKQGELVNFPIYVGEYTIEMVGFPLLLPNSCMKHIEK